ncbi:MAG: type I DNA topoisomerase [Candidatus Taylorbacteria bacterium]|nr:type I DNA topoisomerase [Candidatus Taylorbacteria bacterium]
MKLLIVESPAKAKTISKYLDGEYTVKASVGHIRDLPKNNKKAIDIAAGFVPNYEISPGKEKIVSELKSLAKKSSVVLLATDPDREGEAIAWHIAAATGLTHPKRVVFHEITKDAVQEAIKHPRDIDDNLRKAQEARRVLDRLVGYDLSGLIWKKVRYGLSAGRVQSPALRILMEREREIRAFKSEKFWTINADVESSSNVAFTLTCSDEPKDRKEVDRILEIGNKEKWSVIDLSETEAKRSPRSPFITSTIQQTASSRLGMSPSKTMGIAQKLYEKGLITYMRTDSTNLSTFAQKQIEVVVGKKYGAELYSARVFAKKSKNAQEAHEAIRPTDLTKEHAGATPEQKELYSLIWQRTVASQMIDAKILRTKLTANVTSKSIPDFVINGSRVLTPGWLLADPSARGEDVELPKVIVGEKLTLKELRTEEKETPPPPRYSEAGLIKELEKRGIGRPSTYASIIRTIEERGYVNKLNKALFPTDTGDVVSSFLEENFKDYISDGFTAEMENKLDLIAEGKMDYEKTLRDFYTPFLKELKSKDKLEKVTNMGDADPDMKCPKCDGAMVIKLAKNGKFLSCSKFPDCAGARTIDGKELQGPRVLDEMCPKCNKSKLVEREGRFGKFIACGSYPKCKFIKKDAELEKQNSTGVACPTCKNGMMTERRGRFGLFYSCSNYPDCKNAIKAKPTGNLCKICNSLMMLGTKTIPERCSVKTCPNHNPHKLA